MLTTLCRAVDLTEATEATVCLLLVEMNTPAIFSPTMTFHNQSGLIMDEHADDDLVTVQKSFVMSQANIWKAYFENARIGDTPEYLNRIWAIVSETSSKSFRDFAPAKTSSMRTFMSCEPMALSKPKSMWVLVPTEANLFDSTRAQPVCIVSELSSLSGIQAHSKAHKKYSTMNHIWQPERAEIQNENAPMTLGMQVAEVISLFPGRACGDAGLNAQGYFANGWNDDHQSTEPVANLRDRVIACLIGALSMLSRDDTPTEWAMIQRSLGLAYMKREPDHHPCDMEAAITCFEAALTVFTHNETPRQWAATQGNLATAYRSRMVGDRAANLERALQCLEASTDVAAPVSDTAVEIFDKQSAWDVL